jgi:hypothetical protein
VKKHNRIWFLAGILIFIAGACQVFTVFPTVTAESEAGLPSEIRIQEIPLTEPASESRSEFSGMAWYGDTLILLPQFPRRFADGEMGAVFALEKAQILDFLEGKTSAPLDPKLIPFDDDGLKRQVGGFEGFESIAFNGDDVYLTVEAHAHGMMGYLVKGHVQPDLSEIKLDSSQLVQIPPPIVKENFSDEASLVYQDSILTFYEANGAQVNPSPAAHKFSLDLQPQDPLPFPNIEYRITDTAPPDQNGRFWAINYLFPIDVEKIKPEVDPLAEQYAEGPTAIKNITVERLVQFQIDADGIHLVDRPPVQLRLAGDVAPRNWEALALLDERGFLIATDKYSRTIFAFVPYEDLH